ncbi:hypothetical protein Hdeb2414_s0002g00060161 [Helianthus debilis subsp. tardiflorus]
MLVSLSKPYSFHSAALSSSLCNPIILHLPPPSSTLIFLRSPSHSLSRKQGRGLKPYTQISERVNQVLFLVGSFLPCFRSSSCFHKDGVRKMKITMLCRSEFSSYIHSFTFRSESFTFKSDGFAFRSDCFYSFTFHLTASTVFFVLLLLFCCGSMMLE